MNKKYNFLVIVYQRCRWGLEKVWIYSKTLKKALILQTMLSCNQIQFQAIIEQILLQGGGEQLSLGTINFARTWPIITRTKHKQELLCLYQQGFASHGEQPGAVSLEEVQVWILLPWASNKTGSMCLFLSLTPVLVSTSVLTTPAAFQKDPERILDISFRACEPCSAFIMFPYNTPTK